ncbi:MAG TPA: DUF6683 family protein [Chthoniobacterales bacterium]|nr:DUF6683 family protein [Chthoniobacterales bacterium]
MALMASISLGTALADSTDEALNQFYVENMATRLTSEAPAGASEEPPSGQKAENEQKARKGVRPHKTTAASTHTSNLPASSPVFSYRDSPAVTQKAHVNLAMAVAKNNAQNVPVLQKEFATNPETRFDARFSRYGYSSHNVADSLAGFVIVLWEIVNNQDASAHPSGIREVRAKVNELLLSKSAGKAYTDAEKQYYSDYFKVLAVISKDSLQRKWSANDVAGVQTVHNTAYQIGLKLGIDFKRLQLTDSGFKKI